MSLMDAAEFSWERSPSHLKPFMRVRLTTISGQGISCLEGPVGVVMRQIGDHVGGTIEQMIRAGYTMADFNVKIERW